MKKRLLLLAALLPLCSCTNESSSLSSIPPVGPVNMHINIQQSDGFTIALQGSSSGNITNEALVNSTVYYTITKTDASKELISTTITADNKKIEPELKDNVFSFQMPPVEVTISLNSTSHVESSDSYDSYDYTVQYQDCSSIFSQNKEAVIDHLSLSDRNYPIYDDQGNTVLQFYPGDSIQLKKDGNLVKYGLYTPAKSVTGNIKKEENKYLFQAEGISLEVSQILVSYCQSKTIDKEYTSVIATLSKDDKVLSVRK